MKEIINEFDTSAYPRYNTYNIPQVNKKIIGKFKYENNGKIMEEFVGVKAKMYAIKVLDKETKKSKGVKKSVVKN